MYKKFLSMMVISTVLLGSGCATREYIQAQQECSPKAYALFPSQYYQSVELRSKWVKVPHGQTCTSSTSGSTVTTHCEDIMQDERVEVPQEVTKDANQPERDRYINGCASQLCLKRYGNPECKTAQTR